MILIAAWIVIGLGVAWMLGRAATPPDPGPGGRAGAMANPAAAGFLFARAPEESACINAE
jgi:hypothetical protein